MLKVDFNDHLDDKRHFKAPWKEEQGDKKEEWGDGRNKSWIDILSHLTPGQRSS